MAKQKKTDLDNLKSRRASIGKMVSSEFKLVTGLKYLSIKASTNPYHKFQDLMRFLKNKEFLLQAMGTVSKKAGALTPGIDKSSADRASLKTVEGIISDIQNHTFRFKPVKRFYVDKTGKNPTINTNIEAIAKTGQLTAEKAKELKARPLGILSFRDKIVHEAIRMILNALYEPDFDKINSNYGFRPNVGIHEAINTISVHAKAMTFAIEADITGAFDNVDHDILIGILRKRISDEKFLKLVYWSLKSGISYAGAFQETKIGTTQGSPLSPILYNIYFNEFDKYIKEDFTKEIEQINVAEKRTNSAPHRYYSYLTNTKSQLKLKVIKQRLKELFEKEGSDSDKFKTLYSEFKRKKARFFELDKLQKKFPSKARHKQTIRFLYTRYADDWVFFTNASLERTMEIKEKFSNWIADKLKLKLSPEKTLVSDLSTTKVRFLGFTMSYYRTKRVTKVGQFKKLKVNVLDRTKLIKVPLANQSRIRMQRTSSNALIIAFDRTRVFDRLVQTRFIHKKSGQYYGRRKPEWTVLQIPEIIERYNYVIRGYLDYYGAVTTYSLDIEIIHYLLTYSCAHTLANKLNTSIRKIFTKFGRNLTIKWYSKTTRVSIETIKKVIKVEKKTSLINWNQAKEIIKTRIKNYRDKIAKRKGYLPLNFTDRPVDSLPEVKINWRTKYKLSRYCAICGSNDDIEYHHVRHIRKGKVEGFLQVLKQLNRKQIPCCKECHQKIHKGEYDSIALRDLYDEELVIL